VVLVLIQILIIETILEAAHCAGREGNEDNVVERLFQEHLHLVNLHILWSQTAPLEEGLLRRGKSHQASHSLVIGSIRSIAEKQRNLRVAVGKIVIDMAQLVMGGLI